MIAFEAAFGGPRFMQGKLA